MTTLLTHAGWTWLIVALGTTAVALALAAWRTWQSALRPQAQHRIAVAALASCLVLVLIAPLALTGGAGRPAPASPAPRGSGPVASTAKVAAPTLAQRSNESTQTANAVAGAVGALWLAGAALMGARLLGGWVVVRRLVRSARPIASPEMQTAAVRVQSAMGVRTPVRVFESSQVDVPIVVGCRPVLILPPDLQTGPSKETLEPLLAHELAHVVRRDYLMNMLQSAADAVLFAFPGARWISARIRETREGLLRRDGAAGLWRHAAICRGPGWNRDAQCCAATGGGAWRRWTAPGHTHTAPALRRPRAAASTDTSDCLHGVCGFDRRGWQSRNRICGRAGGPASSERQATGGDGLGAPFRDDVCVQLPAAGVCRRCVAVDPRRRIRV